jgi:hypothetical protein
MGLPNVDKGKLRRMVVSCTADVGDSRTVTVKLADGFGVAVPDNLQSLAAVGTISSASSFGSPAVRLTVVAADATTITVTVPSTGTLVAKQNLANAAGASTIYTSIATPDASGNVAFAVANTANEIVTMLIESGNDSYAFKAQYD